MDSLYNTYLKLLKVKDIPEFINKYLDVPSLKRLKNIGYFCGMDYASKNIYNFKEYITRFDHSLSTALLTYKLTKNKIETLAALFHDIATPCFSHVIDYMNKDYENQESTEEYTSEIIKQDYKLQEYFKEDNINIEDIINFKKYSIVDNHRPKLCADRLDGIILNGISWAKNINESDIKEIVNDLKVYDNKDKEKELGFKSKDIALKTIKINEEIEKLYHSSEDNYMMELLANITRTSIENKIITYKDLYYLDEPNLFKKIKASKVEKLKSLMDKFKNIKKEEIPPTIINNIKIRNIIPIANNTRINNIS
ncbi:MAG: HD domain-containing protein [Bacilli bacterium]|jgi:HD superfamily phosphohydrolase|nr:HD domain-containing protein [Bacilli bacterium]